MIGRRYAKHREAEAMRKQIEQFVDAGGRIEQEPTPDWERHRREAKPCFFAVNVWEQGLR